MDQQVISNVVEEVLRRLASSNAPGSSSAGASTGGRHRAVAPGNDAGLFESVDAAVDAATHAQQQLAQAGVDVRDGICKLIKRIAQENAREWGRIELEETKVGRLDHKIAKLELLQNVPGVEFLRTHGTSGDNGIGLDEAAPWGVIGVITPVTHSIPTLSANAINMIAAGNSLVVNAHPSGAKCLALAVSTYNRAIKAQFDIDPLICPIDPPTLRSAEEIFAHPGVPLLVATGGPAVARAAMKQSKRSIVAGPGNPPVVVDETADFDNAARSIIAGAAFDNNLLCIGEKEVFVVESVFDKMMAAMRRAGAMELTGEQIVKLTKAAFTWQKDHHAVSKDLIGKDPQVMGKLAGFDVRPGVELLFGETGEDNPFVPEEQMMPFVPFVRVRDFDQALELAIKHEHGFGHTALIHSNNLSNITTMGRAMNTTLFVVNGPCVAALGSGGNGYPSYSIATPTGEGVTNPMTFTRFRRLSVRGSLRIV
ncbi:MAG: aldehyde dehydrogenase family protein [Phycisphaeraceae bacterium]